MGVQVRTPLPVYTTGTIAGNAGSAVITGTNTNFTTTDSGGNTVNSIQGGDVLITAQGPIPIKSVDFSTQITLEVPLAQSINSGSSYRIIKYQPNLTGGVLAALQAILGMTNGSTPVSSNYVDNGAGRAKLGIAPGGDIQITVGASQAADSAMLVALDISQSGAVSFPNTVDLYRYRKAVNANSTTVAAGGWDAFLGYVAANFSPGSNAAGSVLAATAPPNGDFETLALQPWLTSIGVTATFIATLRSLALTQGF